MHVHTTSHDSRDVLRRPRRPTSSRASRPCPVTSVYIPSWRRHAMRVSRAVSRRARRHAVRQTTDVERVLGSVVARAVNAEAGGKATEDETRPTGVNVRGTRARDGVT